MELTKQLHSNRSYRLKYSRVTCLLAISFFVPSCFAESNISLNCQALVFVKGSDTSKNVGLENFQITVKGNSTVATVDVSGSTRLLLNVDIREHKYPLRRHILQVNESDFYVETSLQHEGRNEKQSLRIFPSGKLIFTSWVQGNVYINAEGNCAQPWLLFANRDVVEQP